MSGRTEGERIVVHRRNLLHDLMFLDVSEMVISWTLGEVLELLLHSHHVRWRGTDLQIMTK